VFFVYTIAIMITNLKTMVYQICLVVLFLVIPGISQAETIESFDSHIVIAADSSLEVHEKISYTFDGFKHGIFRTIPTNHPDEATNFYTEKVIEIEVTSVLMDGNSVPYTIDELTGEMSIKIGDPDRTIDGTHTYEIMYTVRGGLVYLDSGEVELYWNVTGNDWLAPISKATAKISGEPGLFLEQKTCYEGFVGLDDTCDISETEEGEIVFSSTNLIVGEGLTIAQSLDATKVAKVEITHYKWWMLILPFLMIAMVYGAIRLYLFEVAHKTGKTIIAQYEPYPGVKPMYTGFLFDERLDTRDITAGIVYLAEQGYITIKKTEKTVLFVFEVDDYELTIKKVPDANVTNFERTVLELLFGTNLLIGTTVSLHDLKNNLSKQTKNQKILETLKAELSADLIIEGFFEKGSSQSIHFMWYVLGFFAAIFLTFFIGPIIILVVVAVVVWLVVRERRRSRKGYEALDHLKGFKLFLEMTDKERFDFHNAPEKSPEQFMEYLPYAIAFGVEEKWATAFEGIVTQNPDWYDGGSGSTFSALNLTTSMNAFSTALASSGTSSSASSGGGSSGGGGGGGGGGSW
jgi:uncharacterized membrane protein